MDMETSTWGKSTVRPHIDEREVCQIHHKCRAFNLIELDSDLRIVSANFRICFRKFKQTPSDRVKYINNTN